MLLIYTNRRSAMPPKSAPHAVPHTRTAEGDSRSPLNSRELLGTNREIAIRHHDEIYRLRRTRQGKLILTK